MIKTFDLLASNIEDLELKLDGKLPVNRDELLALANSWERDDCFYTYDKDENEVLIGNHKSNYQYDLSNLDVSEITNFNDIFYSSYFDGDISKWDVSNVTSMEFMFYNTPQFNSDISKWNISNVTNLGYMFYKALSFNQNINSWDISKVISIESIFERTEAFNQPILWDISHIEYCNNMLSETEAFKNIFNNGKDLARSKDEIKEWLKDNQNKMGTIDIEENKNKILELDNFISNLNVIDSTNLNGLHNN